MDPPLPPVDWGNIVLGWEMYIMSNNRAEPISDFHPAVRAEWEHSDRPRSGLRTVAAQSGHRSEISSAQRLRSASRSSDYAQSSIMASGQEIIPVGEAAAALYDDASMNSSNGPASPLVVEPSVI